MLFAILSGIFYKNIRMLFDILTKIVWRIQKLWAGAALWRTGPVTGGAFAEKRRSHAEIGGTLLPRGFGGQRLVDGDESSVTDGDFSVYDGIIDRTAHADGRKD